MPKKIQNTTKATLVSVPLPNHAATYTVISHQFVIDYAYQSLAAAGFGIVDEEYRCTADGQIAQGIYKLNFNNDPELSMMFAWTNSYNKQVKFKCVVGAYINKTGGVMISGEVGSWVRKHTGSADTETKATIDDYITNAYMYYTQLCSDKAAMEVVNLNKRKQSQLLGVLFAEYEILTTEQASAVRDQMKKPYHVFTNTDSLWAFYNYVTNALQSSHPKTWMEDQRILHYFIGTICDFSQPVSQPVAIVNEPVEEETQIVDPLYADPRQTNILDQIAEAELSDNQVVQEEVEAEEVISLEPTPEDYEQFSTEEILEYTDPIGNTFEVPIIEESFTEKVINEISEKFEAEAETVWIENSPSNLLEPTEPIAEETEEDVFALEDNFDLDFSDDNGEEEAPDFF